MQRGPSPPGCQHQVLVLATQYWSREESPPKRRFFMARGQRMGPECGQCRAERLLEHMTEEVRRSGHPWSRTAIACLGSGLGAIHRGWRSHWQLGPHDVPEPWLDDLVQDQVRHFRWAMADLPFERGWTARAKEEKAVFRRCTSPCQHHAAPAPR